MNKHEKHLHDMLHSADMEAVAQLAEQFPAADDAAKERIFQNILKQQQIQKSAESIQSEPVSVVQHSRYRSIWAAAAFLLICGGIIGTAALHRPGMTPQAPETATETIRQPVHYSDPASEPEEKLESVQQTDAAEQPETTIVTVITENAGTDAVRDASETIVMQESHASETIAQEVVTTMMQETTPMQTATETEAAEPPMQNHFTFISMAENLPVVPGFTVTPSENGWGNPTCVIWPENTSEGKFVIEKRYQAAYLPEGWELETDEIYDPYDTIFESELAEGHQRYVYDKYYDMSAIADGTEPLTDFYLIITQQVMKRDGQDLPFAQGETSYLFLREQKYVLDANGIQEMKNPSYYAYAAAAVNGQPAFIYREDHPGGNSTRSVWYTLYWEQDGYMFSVFLGDIPESYLPELIRVAESMQPIE